MNPRVHPLHTDIEPPQQLNDPFNYEPHPLCILAAEEVKKYVRAHEELLEDAEKGEMFGVLIVKPTLNPSRREGDLITSNSNHGSLPSGGLGVGFLAAYAGLLAQRNDWDWFVPPIFDAQQPDGRFKQTEAKISALNHQIEQLTDEKAILELKHRRKEMSNDLLLWLFEQYNLINYKGEVRNVVDIWRDYHNSPKLLRKFPLPPGGTGECCAPKLFQYAFQHGLQPLAIAEFWWGESPKREIRHHFQFYPACNGKCKPILTWQLKRLSPRPPYREGAITSETDKNSLPSGGAGVGLRSVSFYIPTLYIDDQIAVVVKPEGLLSVPGNTGEISLYDIMRQRFPNATGPMMVHRLDQATSGIMVVAKTEFAYKQLQRQFENREVKKRYVAMIQPTLNPSRREGENTSEANKNSLPSGGAGVGCRGTISLPLAPDYYCAHQDGLGMPIVGDDLYGFHSDRLYLHAEYLTFTHPLTGEKMEFEKAPDF